nr:MAG TPA: hypothetical protein [Caudoviricetes sp.]
MRHTRTTVVILIYNREGGEGMMRSPLFHLESFCFSQYR